MATTMYHGSESPRAPARGGSAAVLPLERDREPKRRFARAFGKDGQTLRVRTMLKGSTLPTSSVSDDKATRRT
jgi:hypothetical protein